MINDGLLLMMLVWGVWLLVPIITDGASAFWQVALAMLFLPRTKKPSLPKKELPRVSIIVPAYNEQLNITSCILGLKAQTYPHHLMEVIIVDDGSADATGPIVRSHIEGRGDGHKRLMISSLLLDVDDFQSTDVLHLIERKRGEVARHGKPAAVNAGLARAKGDIIIAIDSDIVLEPEAVANAVRAFLADEDMVAATGHLIVDPYLAFEEDADGGPHLNAEGLPVPKALSGSERALTACQFLEYANAFHMGRRSESVTDTMFTLSGACAVFRREVFTANGGYRARTVSEDTDMTLTAHRLPGKHIGYMEDVRVHLAPTLTWSDLYSQRTRWQRGELEVSAFHLNAEREPEPASKRMFWRIALPMRLQMDHTLALPRIVWTFLLFMLPLFGYSLEVILQALALMMMFYTFTNALRTLVSYMFSSPPEKVFIREYLGYIPLLPLYNMFLFWVRVNAALIVLNEDAQWTVKNAWLERVEALNMKKLQSAAARLFTFLLHVR
jgi:cellulose synthase/poly-beta-1,6-N-acetylglucosamine synthase-like glycosyltransferase